MWESQRRLIWFTHTGGRPLSFHCLSALCCCPLERRWSAAGRFLLQELTFLESTSKPQANMSHLQHYNPSGSWKHQPLILFVFFPSLSLFAVCLAVPFSPSCLRSSCLSSSSSLEFVHVLLPNKWRTWSREMALFCFSLHAWRKFAAVLMTLETGGEAPPLLSSPSFSSFVNTTVTYTPRLLHPVRIWAAVKTFSCCCCLWRVFWERRSRWHSIRPLTSALTALSRLSCVRCC